MDARCQTWRGAGRHGVKGDSPAFVTGMVAAGREALTMGMPMRHAGPRFELHDPREPHARKAMMIDRGTTDAYLRATLCVGYRDAWHGALEASRATGWAIFERNLFAGCDERGKSICHLGQYVGDVGTFEMVSWKHREGSLDNLALFCLASLLGRRRCVGSSRAALVMMMDGSPPCWIALVDRIGMGCMLLGKSSSDFISSSLSPACIVHHFGKS